MTKIEKRSAIRKLTSEYDLRMTAKDSLRLEKFLHNFIVAISHERFSSRSAAFNQARRAFLLG